MKRFTATEKWDDSWFRKLKPEHKLFWQFILDRCDNSGVWKIDIEAAEFFIGTTISAAGVLEVFEGRIRDIGRGRWWVVNFIEFQCGELREKCVPHQKIILTLKSHGLYDEYKNRVDSRVEHTHKEEDKDKEEDKEKEGKGFGENPPSPIEPPPGFPKTEEEARGVAAIVGVPGDFAATKWHDAIGSGFIDWGSRRIQNFGSFIKASWNRKQDRDAQERLKKPSPTSTSMEKPKANRL